VLIEVPDPSLVLLIGPSGAGKTTFARRHFSSNEVLASDAFRALVADDEDVRDADGDAFQALRFVAAKRLRRGRLTVIDATNVRPRSRRPFVALALNRGLPAMGLVFALPDPVLRARNRAHRALAPEVLDRQALGLRDSLNTLAREGIAPVYVLDSEQAVEEAVVRRTSAAVRPAANAGPSPAATARQLDLLEP
jgi:protein phosphatase